MRDVNATKQEMLALADHAQAVGFDLLIVDEAHTCAADVGSRSRSRHQRHELVHVEQWRLHGAVGFLRAYLGASRWSRIPNAFSGFDPNDNVQSIERALTLINTIVALAVDPVKRKPRIGAGFGGLHDSGHGLDRFHGILTD